MAGGAEGAPARLALQDVSTLRRGAFDTAGVWRYAAAIPVPESVGRALSLGEGGTPLVSAGAGELAGVHVKLEFVSPTGSFKDRGAVVLVTRAVQCGAGELIADSSGNAGSAIAAFAARAGLPCRVFVPAATSAGKRAQIAAYGAVLEAVPGDRTATAERAVEAVRERDAFYASHVHDPYFLQGTKTFAFELWEQLAELPGAVVIPAGNGTLLLGTAIGFAELRAAGLIDRVPALIAVQSERCPPLAAAWRRSAMEPEPVRALATAAEGIAIPRPARGAEMLAAVRASGGCVVAVPEAAIGPARADLASRGMLVEPTAAVAWAAVLMARSPGWPERGQAHLEDPVWAELRRLVAGSVVVPLCGSGLKAAGARAAGSRAGAAAGAAAGAGAAGGTAPTGGGTAATGGGPANPGDPLPPVERNSPSL